MPTIIACAAILAALSACTPGEENSPPPKQDATADSTPSTDSKPSADPKPDGTSKAGETSDPDFSNIPEFKEAVAEAAKRESGGDGQLRGRSLKIPTGGPRNQLDFEGDPPSKENPGAVFSVSEYKRIAKLPSADFIELRRKVLGSSAGNPVKASFYSNGCTKVPSILLTEKDWQACAQHDFRYTVGPNTIKDADERRADEIDADTDLEKNAEYFLLRKSQPFFSALRAAGLSNYFATPTTGEEINDINSVIVSHVPA
ncbi:hypothetical protein ACFWAR_01015 [Streptomyces sp. NPDC059917]|uniref:hypothetical protein n=1 Tax=Streptomyces sp. NPDC059917 TaxID=3347002 RepID=UPI0036500615